jgi:hypothetical protein
MNTEQKILEIKCGICGKKVGEYTPPASFTGDISEITPADLGIVDSRCDECEASHGRFSEQADRFTTESGRPFADFLKVIKGKGGDVKTPVESELVKHREKLKVEKTKETERIIREKGSLDAS